MKKCGVIIEPVNILKPISLLQLFETEFASFERRPFAVSVLPYVLPYTQFFPEYNVDGLPVSTSTYSSLPYSMFMYPMVTIRHNSQF